MLIRAKTEDYADQLTQLLPQGEAWPRDPDTVLGKLIAGLAGVFARVHNRALDLIEEADPRTAVESLPEWERETGLPGTCTPIADTLVQRRAAVVARLTARGGQSRPFYISVAAALGYDVTITEFSHFSCNSACDDPVCDEDWTYVWRIDAPEVTIVQMTCQSGCDEPLRAWGNQRLECEISWRKPDHTTLLFGYGG